MARRDDCAEREDTASDVLAAEDESDNAARPPLMNVAPGSMDGIMADVVAVAIDDSVSAELAVVELRNNAHRVRNNPMEAA